MIKNIFSCIVLALVLAGCGAAYKIIVKMQPVSSNEEYVIDSKTGAITVNKENVRIMVAFMNREELEKVTPFISRNPYLSDNKVFFTVFDVLIENNNEDKISMDTAKCVLLDGLGSQFSPLSLEYFKDLYPATVSQTTSYSAVLNEYSQNISYTEDYYKRLVAERTLIKSGDIYQNVRQRGMIVFEQVRRESAEVSLIIPSITVYKAGSEIKKMDLRFKFTQEVKVDKQ